MMPYYPAILFIEDFETAAIGQAPPQDWETEVVSGANYIFFFSSGTKPVCSPYSGTMFVEFQSFNAAGGYQNRLKRTQSVSTVGYTDAVIDFAWLVDAGYSGSEDRVEVQWSTNGETWITAATFLRYNPIQQWVVETVPLPAEASGQPALYLGFLFTSAYGDNCHLDLIHLRANGNNSVTEDAQINALKVFPVPAKDHLFILISDQRLEPVQVRILTIDGQEVINCIPTQKQDNITIDVGNLPEGLYLLEAFTRDGVLSKKNIIQSR
jgi:hypothetical protein